MLQLEDVLGVIEGLEDMAKPHWKGAREHKISWFATSPVDTPTTRE
jgi:hypothetical protein